MDGVFSFDNGMEWVVDAHGCAPERLRDVAAIRALFSRAVQELSLKPVGEAQVHQFPEPGGVTALLMLSESHLSCHTFPESGFAAFNLYCCRPRAEWPWAARLAEHLGATRVEIRQIRRPEAVRAAKVKAS